MTLFDHFEVHVKDIEKYIKFLKIIFEGGTSKKLKVDIKLSILLRHIIFYLKVLKKLFQKRNYFMVIMEVNLKHQ